MWSLCKADRKARASRGICTVLARPVGACLTTVCRRQGGSLDLNEAVYPAQVEKLMFNKVCAFEDVDTLCTEA